MYCNVKVLRLRSLRQYTETKYTLINLHSTFRISLIPSSFYKCIYGTIPNSFYLPFPTTILHSLNPLVPISTCFSTPTRVPNQAKKLGQPLGLFRPPQLSKSIHTQEKHNSLLKASPQIISILSCWKCLSNPIIHLVAVAQGRRERNTSIQLHCLRSLRAPWITLSKREWICVARLSSSYRLARYLVRSLSVRARPPPPQTQIINIIILRSYILCKLGRSYW